MKRIIFLVVAILAAPVLAQERAELFIQALEADTQALETSFQAMETAALALDVWSEVGGEYADEYENCHKQAEFYREVANGIREGAQTVGAFVQYAQNDTTILTDEVYLSLPPLVKEQEARTQINTAKENETFSKNSAEQARNAAWVEAAEAHHRAFEAWTLSVGAWTESAEAWKYLAEYDSGKTTDTGPFGINMGDPVSRVVSPTHSYCRRVSTRRESLLTISGLRLREEFYEEYEPVIHVCTGEAMPNPHSDFDDYVLRSTEETGIFRIDARKFLDYNETYAIEFTTKIANQLSKKYENWDNYVEEVQALECINKTPRYPNDGYWLNMSRRERSTNSSSSKVSCYERLVYTWSRNEARVSDVLEIKLYTDEHSVQANLIFWFRNKDVADKMLEERLLEAAREMVEEEPEQEKEDEQSF